jgi:hypothetical protein
MSNGALEGPPSSVGKASASGPRWLWALLALFVAVALFVAAFYFVGGASYLSTLLAPKTTQPAASSPPAVAAAVVKDDNEEQIESHNVLEQLAAGNTSGIVVTRVQAQEDSATATLIATFRDGTYAPGKMLLLRRNGIWYMYYLRGMRPTPGTNQSGSVAEFTEVETSRTIESIAAQENIVTFDQGVIDTLMTEQLKNQEFVTGVIAGTYNAIDFGAPVPGQGTITLPVTVTGPNNAKVDGQAVMIQKTIDGRPLNFLVGLNLQ